MSRGLAGAIGTGLAAGVNQYITSNQEDQDRNRKNDLFDAEAASYKEGQAGLMGEHALAADRLDTVLDPSFNPIRSHIAQLTQASQALSQANQPQVPAPDAGGLKPATDVTPGAAEKDAPNLAEPVQPMGPDPFGTDPRTGGPNAGVPALGQALSFPRSPHMRMEAPVKTGPAAPEKLVPTPSVPIKGAGGVSERVPSQPLTLGGGGRAQAAPKPAANANDLSKQSSGLYMSQQGDNLAQMQKLSDQYDQISQSANRAIQAAPAAIQNDPRLLKAYKAAIFSQLKPQLDPLEQQAGDLTKQVAFAHLQDVSHNLLQAYATHDVKAMQSVMKSQGMDPSKIDGFTFGVDPKTGSQALMSPDGKSVLPATMLTSFLDPTRTTDDNYKLASDLDKTIASIQKGGDSDQTKKDVAATQAKAKVTAAGINQAGANARHNTPAAVKPTNDDLNAKAAADDKAQMRSLDIKIASATPDQIDSLKEQKQKVQDHYNELTRTKADKESHNKAIEDTGAKRADTYKKSVDQKAPQQPAAAKPTVDGTQAPQGLKEGGVFKYKDGHTYKVINGILKAQ